MAVSKRLRFEILRRDNHACRYCGRSAPEVRLTIDHVVPSALGGSDEPSNLITACTDCNSGKTSVPADAPIVADVASDALRWAAAMRRATEMASLDRDARYKLAESFLRYWEGIASRWDRIGQDWEQTIDRFSALGLTEDDLLEAANTALLARNVTAANRWRYFCGVCWGMIRKRQEVASELVREDVVPVGARLGFGE